MRKYKIFAAVALLAVPFLLTPVLVSSASQLPWIQAPSGSFQQPLCPTGRQFGCFNPNTQIGGNRPVDAGLANATPYPYTPFEPCLQFMQVFLRLAAGSG